eukprot:CAMPEP_0117423162 /NCGR_PEP_ID=MMETSP0758-20121206/3847_1 /TAXON_ID=63605 /ORGANISM="Percolomonas cosmopolitus, Strain AE-1 (ATCC 50343)" /LENGTH=759 /DNA_ID=CAMNT_0005206197 /DNA_START=806 /DNA_END=3082 /DNA_ORIENTATION=-
MMVMGIVGEIIYVIELKRYQLHYFRKYHRPLEVDIKQNRMRMLRTNILTLILTILPCIKRLKTSKLGFKIRRRLKKKLGEHYVDDFLVEQKELEEQKRKELEKKQKEEEEKIKEEEEARKREEEEERKREEEEERKRQEEEELTIPTSYQKRGDTSLLMRHMDTQTIELEKDNNGNDQRTQTELVMMETSSEKTKTMNNISIQHDGDSIIPLKKNMYSQYDNSETIGNNHQQSISIQHDGEMSSYNNNITQSKEISIQHDGEMIEKEQEKEPEDNPITNSTVRRRGKRSLFRYYEEDPTETAFRGQKPIDQMNEQELKEYFDLDTEMVMERELTHTQVEVLGRLNYLMEQQQQQQEEEKSFKEPIEILNDNEEGTPIAPEEYFKEDIEVIDETIDEKDIFGSSLRVPQEKEEKEEDEHITDEVTTNARESIKKDHFRSVLQKESPFKIHSTLDYIETDDEEDIETDEEEDIETDEEEEKTRFEENIKDSVVIETDDEEPRLEENIKDSVVEEDSHKRSVGDIPVEPLKEEQLALPKKEQHVRFKEPTVFNEDDPFDKFNSTYGPSRFSTLPSLTKPAMSKDLIDHSKDIIDLDDIQLKDEEEDIKRPRKPSIAAEGYDDDQISIHWNGARQSINGHGRRRRRGKDSSTSTTSTSKRPLTVLDKIRMRQTTTTPPKKQQPRVSPPHRPSPIYETLQKFSEPTFKPLTPPPMMKHKTTKTTTVFNALVDYALLDSQTNPYAYKPSPPVKSFTPISSLPLFP